MAYLPFPVHTDNLDSFFGDDGWTGRLMTTAPCVEVGPSYQKCWKQDRGSVYGLQ